MKNKNVGLINLIVWFAIGHFMAKYLEKKFKKKYHIPEGGIPDKVDNNPAPGF